MPSNNTHSTKPHTLVHADHLGLTYGETEVLTDLCFDIQRGSFVSIVGPNGAGKTQLMRTMLRLTEATSGYIDLNFDMSTIGYVPQRIYVDPTFPITVREFLQLYAQPKGFWFFQQLPQLDEQVSVEHLLDKQLGKLSGGQIQRVMLAAVLSTDPEILFLDEFSAGVDPRGQAELYSYLHKRNERDGITIIMISHDIDITTQYADYALCLNKQLVCTGRPHDVFTAETFQQMYGLPLTKLQHEDHHHETSHYA